MWLKGQNKLLARLSRHCSTNSSWKLEVGGWELSRSKKSRSPEENRPELTSLSVSYQVTRTPNRSTRGATIAWIWLAFAAFCVPRIACTVFPLVRLNTSSDGTNLT